LYGAEVKETNFKANLIVNSSSLSLNGDKVIIAVDNYVQQKQLVDFREEATLFIREKLNNYGITLDAVIKQTEETKQQALTANEKYKLLAKKYPALEKLKEILQLEINH